MQQNPLFAFRILVDIALKALSPAINDPTTAVLAIDQIHRLLRVLGSRELYADEILDPTGRLRVIFRMPNWQDFMHLACNEIRCIGAGSMQVARRLRAMLENLARTLPPDRCGALREELHLLDQTVAGFLKLPQNLELARIPDSQGLGASTNSPLQ